MGMLFENFQAYDVQETRRIEHEKAVKEVTEQVMQQATEEGVAKMIQVIKELGNTREDAIQKIMEKYAFAREAAEEKVDLYW